MNDRGLPLTPLDMLKGFLLSKMAAEPPQRMAFRTWKARTRAPRDLGEEEDADAVKA
jgi:hypothetical protein